MFDTVIVVYSVSMYCNMLILFVIQSWLPVPYIQFGFLHCDLAFLDPSCQTKCPPVITYVWYTLQCSSIYMYVCTWNGVVSILVIPLYSFEIFATVQTSQFLCLVGSMEALDYGEMCQTFAKGKLRSYRTHTYITVKVHEIYYVYMLGWNRANGIWLYWANWMCCLL